MMRRRLACLGVAATVAVGACSGADDSADESAPASSDDPGPATTSATTIPPASTATTMPPPAPAAETTTSAAPTSTTTTEPPPSPLDVIASPAAARATLWTHPDPMLAAPLLADGVVIALTAEGDDQILLGVDPETGAGLWRRPWGRSSLFRGFRNAPRLSADGVIIGLEDRPMAGSEDAAVVVGIDPTTGANVWESPSLTTSNPPSTCRSDRFVCLAATIDGAANSLLAIDASTGEIVATGQIQDDDVTLGDRLILRSSSARTSIVRYDETHQNIEWQVDQDELFGAAPVASRYGFGADIDEAAGVVVVQFGLGPRRQPEIYVRDYETAIHAGIDLATGEVLWREIGSNPECQLDLPEPDVDDVDSRCRHVGSIEFELQDDGSYPFVQRSPISTRVELFDPTTGATLSALDSLTLPALTAEDEFEPDVRLYGAALDGVVIAIDDDGTVAAMAWETGAVAVVAEPIVAWCSVDGFEIEGSTWSARGGHTPCDIPSFAPTDTMAPTAAPPTVGVEHDGITVYLGEGRLIALAPA